MLFDFENIEFRGGTGTGGETLAWEPASNVVVSEDRRDGLRRPGD